MGDAKVIESFDCFVEEIQEEAFSARTVSSEGEEGIAWIEKKAVPAEELEFLRILAEFKVEIWEDDKGTTYRVRFRRRTRPEVNLLRPEGRGF